MTDDRLAAPEPGPVLLCAGTDAASAARLAEATVALLDARPVVVLAVWEPPPVMSGYDAVMDALYDTHAELRATLHASAATAANAACEILDAHGWQVSRRVVPDERGPWRTVLDVADEIDASLIVAGVSEGPDVQPGAIGRNARGLAHRARRPLLLLPAGIEPAAADAPAIVAFDGSAPAEHAIGIAAGLLRPRPAIVAEAWQSAADTVALALIALPAEVVREGADGLDARARGEAQSHAEAGADLLAHAGWPCEPAAPEVRTNVPSAIVAEADARDTAIIVTGTRGRSRVAAALLGSTAESILRQARRPVLLVPPPAAAE
jgi:nucleotide-binding universal stress UspA family protein